MKESEVVTTRWVCDRCGQAMEVDGYHPPSGWDYLWVHRATYEYDVGRCDHRKIGQLCPACLASFVAWWGKDVLGGRDG